MRWLYSTCLAIALTSCSSINTEDILITPDKEYFSPSPSIIENEVNINSYPNLELAYNQINSSGTEEGLLESKKFLSDNLANDPLIQKLIIISKTELIDGKKSSIEISEDDIETYTRMLSNNYGASNIVENGNEVDEIIKSYFKLYYSNENGFVDRNGIKYSMPNITTSIGNDAITAIAKIVLEGIFDAILENPVYANSTCVTKDEKKECTNKYLTAGGKQPSASKLKYVETIEVTMNKDDDTPGYITEDNINTIQYLSGLAGDQSKILSGMLVREFGGFELTFVIGAHFSFGDNDTFAELMDTIFEVTSRRLTEVYAYKRLGSGASTIDNIQNLVPINDEGPGGSPPREHPEGPNCFRDCL